MFKFNPITGTLDIVGSSGGGGGGDVVGPASNDIDGQLPLFDGTTGKLLKAGGIADDGNHFYPLVDNNHDLGVPGNQFANAYLGNSITMPSLTIIEAGDRIVFDATGVAKVMEFQTNGATRLYIAEDKPQVSVLEADTFWEQNGTGKGSLGWLSSGLNDIGWVQGQQDVLPGFHQPRHIALSNNLYFVAISESASTNLSSGVSRFEFNGGTSGANNKAVDLKNVAAHRIINTATTDYLEIYLGLSGLQRMQTNVNFGLNSNGTIGKLCFTDINGNPNGKRLETVTLAAGTVTKGNTSITANSVLIISNGGLAGAALPPAYSYTISAGVGYTITSSDVTDTSVLKVTVLENGY
jgi:hypothetical protein